MNPVNPTNPNALENQPNGNGNAESLLHNEVKKPDSNAYAGEVGEKSLASTSASIGTANANAVQEEGTGNAANTEGPSSQSASAGEGSNAAANTEGAGNTAGTDPQANPSAPIDENPQVQLSQEDIDGHPKLKERGLNAGDKISQEEYNTLTGKE